MTRVRHSLDRPHRHIVAVFLLALAARSVSAQEPSSQSPGSENDVLRLNVSSFGAYDDGLMVERTASTARDGLFTGIDVDLWRLRRGRRFGYGWSAGGTLRRYAQFDGLTSSTQYAGLGLGLSAGRRTRVEITGTASRAPYHLLRLFPTPAPAELGEVAVAADAYHLSTRTIASYEAGVSLNSAWGRRSSVTVLSGFRYAGARSKGAPTLSARHVGGRWTTQLTRDAALRVGYVVETAQYGYGLAGVTPPGDRAHSVPPDPRLVPGPVGPLTPSTPLPGSPALVPGPVAPPAWDGAATPADRTVSLHNLDLGIDYNRALSFSRRTTVSIASGTAIVHNERERDYRLTGSVALGHAMGRTWRARLTYQRGLQFIEGLLEPSFADAVIADLEGMLGRRADVRMQLTYADGALGLGAAKNPHGSYGGEAQLQWAFDPRLSAYLRYTHHHVRFSGTAGLSPGLPLEIDRHRAQAGVTWALPLTGQRR